MIEIGFLPSTSTISIRLGGSIAISSCTSEDSAFCERIIGRVRQRCLDWLIPVSGAHLRSILKCWTAHHNAGHSHRALGPAVPDLPGKHELIPMFELSHRGQSVEPVQSHRGHATVLELDGLVRTRIASGSIIPTSPDPSHFSQSIFLSPPHLGHSAMIFTLCGTFDEIPRPT